MQNQNSSITVGRYQVNSGMDSILRLWNYSHNYTLVRFSWIYTTKGTLDLFHLISSECTVHIHKWNSGQWLIWEQWGLTSLHFENSTQDLLINDILNWIGTKTGWSLKRRQQRVVVDLVWQNNWLAIIKNQAEKYQVDSHNQWHLERYMLLQLMTKIQVIFGCSVHQQDCYLCAFNSSEYTT